MAVCVQMSMESILPKPALYPTLKYGNLLQSFLKDEDTCFCFCCSLLFLKPRPPWRGHRLHVQGPLPPGREELMAPFPSRDGHQAQVSGRKPTEQGGERAPGCAGAMGGRGAAPRHVGCEQGLAALGRQRAGLAALLLGTCWGTAPVWGWRCNLELSLLITSFSGNVEYVFINH